MRTLVIFLVTLCAGFAQETGAIAGRVVHAVNGTAIRKAVVNILLLGPAPALATAITNPEGTFRFEHLPPGRFRLTCAAAGWSTKQIPFGIEVGLGPGEKKEAVRIPLSPLSALSGTVRDEAGQPVMHAQLQLLGVRYPRGKPEITIVGGASSDDRGQYRIFDISPGRFFLRALPGARFAAARTQPTLTYSPEYYGAGDHPPDKANIALRGGEDLRGLDFTLRSSASAKLAGHVEGLPEGVSPQNLNIMLWTAMPHMPALITSMRHEADGGFVVEDLAPGAYEVVVSCITPQGPYRGIARVNVSGGQSQTITIRLLEGIDVAGSLVTEGMSLAGVTVWLTPGDTGSPMISVPPVNPGPDGNFLIRGVVPGIWDINVQPLPAGGFIKSMRLGNQDVLREDMRIDAGTKDALRIVVSSRGAKISGTILGGRKAEAVPVVVAAPQGTNARVVSLYKAQHSELGRFQLDSLTPGTYKLYALTGIADTAWTDPAFLVPYDSKGKLVTVREGEEATVDLDRIEVQP